MGHIHLGVLPKTKRWNEVVGLLTDGADASEIIGASAYAAEKELLAAPNDLLFVEAVRLLAMIPIAARSEDFGRALRDIGLPVGNDPSVFSIMAATGDRLDRFALNNIARSDFGELSRRALLTTLSKCIGAGLPGLFEANSAEVQAATRRFADPRHFSSLAREYFTRLLSDCMRSWLDRTLAFHIGPDKRFADLGERTRFDLALSQYSYETTRIIKEFASGWQGKTLHRDGAIDSRTAAAFGAVAFRKIVAELRQRRGFDD